MDRPATATPATAREIILEIVRNMREGLEPLHYSTLAPAVFHVYLHPDDMDRLRAIVPRIIDESRRALDAEVERLNKASLVERFKLKDRSEPKIAAPDGGWQVTLLENTDDDAQVGDILIHSELAMPTKGDIGAGSMTKRIATRRMGGNEAAATQRFVASDAPPAAPAAAPPASAGTPSADGRLATITYEDNSGKKTFAVTKDQIVVGRGGRDYWTDLKLDTLPDVSREHLRLRRDPESGQWFLKDLSRLGTTIDGEKVPSSIEFAGSEKRDRNLEVPVPGEARIGLAGVVILDFRSSGSNG